MSLSDRQQQLNDTCRRENRTLLRELGLDKMDDEMTVAEPVRGAIANRDYIPDQEVDLLVRESTVQWSTDSAMGIFWGSGKVLQNLPPGMYRCSSNDRIGANLIRQTISVDDLVELRDSQSQAIIHEIEKFWSLKDKYVARGLLHKRGILMSGDPGAGKTSTIQMLIQKLIKLGGIAVYPHAAPSITAECLQMIRKIEPSTPICLIMEDFEVLIQKNGSEAEWLSILDGESQIDNIVFLATTNYLSKLDKRLTDRPSRFDSVHTVFMPTSDSRIEYIKKIAPELSSEDVEMYSEAMDGLSLAHVKEMILAVLVYGYGFDETVARLRKMRSRLDSEDDNLKGTPDEKRSVGFGA